MFLLFRSFTAKASGNSYRYFFQVLDSVPRQRSLAELACLISY